ncbi:hypothetical protein F5887DRAFT_883457 [Amanita rubescens]|nr:hypothetical protein F5887DRAFT_883457 [Amanita rubescens]
MSDDDHQPIDAVTSISTHLRYGNDPKGKTEESSSPPRELETETDGGKGTATTWQAIYSPEYNAYYFYNTETQETTWSNPLASSEPAASTSAALLSTDPRHDAMQQAAISRGIDPALAHLDPSLGSAIPSASVGPDGMSFSAKFNARTGQFTRPDGRDPTHLSEYERMKRMSQFYFDVGAWEDQLSAQGGSIKGEETMKKRKRPSKKDLERFKEQKKLKKIAKTAWLRT